MPKCIQCGAPVSPDRTNTCPECGGEFSGDLPRRKHETVSPPPESELEPEEERETPKETRQPSEAQLDFGFDEGRRASRSAYKL